MTILKWLITDQPTWVGNISNLTSITILGASAGFYKRIMCDQKRCWRIGLHKVKGTTYRTCLKHATKNYHSILKARHATERPSQHELLHDHQDKSS